MSKLVTRSFWQSAGERAVKTAAQAALATIGADSLDALSVDWVGIASVSLGGAVLSLLTSLATFKETES